MKARPACELHSNGWEIDACTLIEWNKQKIDDITESKYFPFDVKWNFVK